MRRFVRRLMVTTCFGGSADQAALPLRKMS